MERMLVHQSRTRRKACAWCVKGKRRCDLLLPTCSRCTERGLLCEYANSAGEVIHSALPTPPPSQPSQKEEYISHDLLIAREEEEPNETFSIITNYLPSLAASTRTTYNIYEDLSTFSSINSFAFPELIHVNNAHLDLCVAHFRNSISTLIQEAPSPFIHPHSYKTTMSPFYQDLLTTAMLYTQKSPSTQSLVFRILELKAKTLVSHFSNCPAWPIDDGLVAVQTLLVYQIIRLFDGDIRLRGAAERDFVHLENWTGNLQQTYLSSTLALPDAALYDRWVYLESARRTIMMSVFLQGMYAQLRDGACPLVPQLAELPMSITAGRLWRFSEDKWWDRAMRTEIEGSHGGLVTYREFVNEWNEGSVVDVDVDVFETVLLVACRYAAVKPSCMTPQLLAL